MVLPYPRYAVHMNTVATVTAEVTAGSFKAISTRFLGPTNSRGSRVAAFDMDGNRATVSMDHSKDSDGNHARAALALCEKMGWTGQLIGGGIKGGYAFVFVESPAAGSR